MRRPAPPRPAPPAAPGPDDVLFDAVLQPHRSLGPRGFLVLMVLVVGVSFAAGVVFMLRGAWPVVGFFGLDAGLIWLAFRASYRSAQAHERLRLTGEALVVRRVSPSGRVQSWRFQPHWLRVHIDEPPQHDSQLTLSSHGRSLAIGAFLAPHERVELAVALRAALARLREPQFC